MFKLLLYAVIGIVLLLSLIYIGFCIKWNIESTNNLALQGKGAPTLSVDESSFQELIFGKFNPTGTLPIEIPSPVEAVEKQFEDVPYDSENNLYKFGFGLSYQ